MKQFDHLPVVDLSGFVAFSWAEAPFLVGLDPVTQKSQEDFDRLHRLLGLYDTIVTLPRGLREPVACRRLNPVAQTRSGKVVVVDLHVEVSPPCKEADIYWLAFVVEPDRYQDFLAHIDCEIIEYRKKLETMEGGEDQ